MKTQHVISASAAAVLVVSMAAFAQSPQTASPATQSPTPSAESSSPSTQSQSPSTPSSSSSQSSPSSQSGDRSASQTSRQPETPVTLVGCVMRETDYRKANDSGKGGPVGTGLGRGDEFVLVNAMKTTAGSTTPATSAECGTTATGEAYELGGSREKDLASYVGRRVEITGTLKEAKTSAASGDAKPTGGFDPLKQDLKLFEVDVASFRALPAAQSGAAPAAQAPAQSPSPSAPPAQPAPQSAAPPAPPATPAPQPQPAPSTAPRQSLPRTASPLPLIALSGLLSVATGLLLRRRA
jgi:hypothetical protein